jgi:hypothetical protein
LDIEVVGQILLPATFSSIPIYLLNWMIPAKHLFFHWGSSWKPRMTADLLYKHIGQLGTVIYEKYLDKGVISTSSEITPKIMVELLGHGEISLPGTIGN